MPFKFTSTDCSPNVIDEEYEIHDEERLAEFVGRIVLGHHYHVRRILQGVSLTPPNAIPDHKSLAISSIRSVDSNGDKRPTHEIVKRDGWVFQIISWLACYQAHYNGRFHCQPPHDAVAQHGLDGLAVILSDTNELERIVITEDKCTESHATRIREVWAEFKKFEAGEFDSKLLSRVTSAIEHLEQGEILRAVQDDIYRPDLRKYRVGINRTDAHNAIAGRTTLFSGYIKCVGGDSPFRRYAATIHLGSVRDWMVTFCDKVIVKINAMQ